MPGVSIAIPTKNRPAALDKVLRSIAEQTVKPHEVIVIDQSPGAPYAHLKGLTASRNVAIDQARGDVILFLDDDVTLDPCFLKNLLAAYVEYPEAAGISGMPDNYKPPGKFYLYWSEVFTCGPFWNDRFPVYWSAATITRPVPVSQMTGAMMSFRRSAINGTRFDENLRGVSDGEDVDFCVRLKGRYLIDPRCKLTHHFDSSGRERGHWVRRHARAYTYLYLKNWRNHPLTYAWLRVGWMVAAALGCASRKSLGPWNSMKAGIKEGRKCVEPHAD